MPYADVGGGKQVWYEEAGFGPPLVLIHEGVADLTMWDEHVPELAKTRRVIRYDLPGYGRSPLPPGPFSWYRDLDGLLDALAVDRAAVVGVSMGGRIALELALERPERVEALGLVAAGLPDWEGSEEMQDADAREEELFDAGDVEGLAEHAVRIWFDGPHRTPADVDPELRERAKEMNRRAAPGQLEAYGREDRPGPPQRLDPPARARLTEVSAPT